MTKGKSFPPSSSISVFPKEKVDDARRVTQDKVLGIVDPLLLMETPAAAPKASKKSSALDAMMSTDDARIDDIFDSLFFSENPPVIEEDLLRRKNTSIESAVQLAALEAAEVFGIKTTEHLAAPHDSSAPHTFHPSLDAVAAATPSPTGNLPSSSTFSDADVVASPPSSGALQRLQHARTDGDLSVASHARTGGDLSMTPNPRATQFSTPALPVDLSTLQFSAPLAQHAIVEPSALIPPESKGDISFPIPLPSTDPKKAVTSPSTIPSAFPLVGAQRSPFHLAADTSSSLSKGPAAVPSSAPSKTPDISASLQDGSLNPHATRVGLSLGQLINPMELGVELVQLSEADLKGSFGDFSAPTATSEDWAAPSTASSSLNDLHESFDDIAREPFGEASRESFDDIARDEWTPPPDEAAPLRGDTINPLQTAMFRSAVEPSPLAPVSIEHLLPNEPAASPPTAQPPNVAPSLFPATRFSETLPLARPTASQGAALGLFEGTPLRHPLPPPQSTSSQGAVLDILEGTPLRHPLPPPLAETSRGAALEILEGTPAHETTLPMQRPHLSTIPTNETGHTPRPPTPPPPSLNKPVRGLTPPPPSAVAATLQDTPRPSLGGSGLSVGATLQDTPRASLANPPSLGATLQDQPLATPNKPNPKTRTTISKEEVDSGVLWSAVPAPSSRSNEEDHAPEETVLEAEVPTAMKAMSMDLLSPKSSYPSERSNPKSSHPSELSNPKSSSPSASPAPTATAPQSPDSGLDQTWLAHPPQGTHAASSLPSAPNSAIAGNSRNTTILPKVRMTGKVHELINEMRERYEVVRKLGEGAVGEVSLAKDNDIQRLVAIKRLKEPTPQTGSLARFVEEIQTNGQLEHPNIAPVHDVGIDAEGRYFFVMKYVRGENLEEILEKLRKADAETHRLYTPHYRAQIALEILRAVQFAHEQGVIHRDLKPSNVIVGPHGEVMVMDWGIAKTLRTSSSTPPMALPEAHPSLFSGDILQKEERVFETSVGTLIGTPAYMSPEQALGLNDRIDQRSDIYSLCAMLYEFFSLQHYMGHKTDIKSMLMGILTEEPVRMDLVRHPHQDPPSRILAALLQKGLSKEPAQRYASVQELSHAIQHDYLEGQNAVACSYSLTRRTGNELLRYLDRHPSLAPMLAVTLVSFALFGGAAAVYFLVRLF